MARMPNRPRPLRCAPLRLEALEERSLLALAAFSVNLYRDAGGQLGDLIADDTVEVGQSFYVEIVAQDVRSAPTGLAGISLDIGWNPEVLTEIDAPFELDAILTGKLPSFRLGELDNAAGTIDNLSASMFLSGQVVGRDAPERFALLHFQAIAPMTDAPLRVRAGVTDIAFFYPVWTTWHDFEFERQGITVVPAESVEAAPTASGPSDALPLAIAQPDAAPLQVDYYQQDGSEPAVATTAAALEAGQNFYAELIVEPSTKSAATSDTAAPIQLETLVPPRTARGESSGFWVTRQRVGSGAAAVDLPITISRVTTLALPPHQAQRVGVLYASDADKAAATDAVFAAAYAAEPPAVGSAAPVDGNLMQAVICGLASSAGGGEFAGDPFWKIPSTR